MNLGALANIVGSGVGVIVIAVTLILLPHVKHLPKFAHPWVRRAMIIAMYGAGSLLAYTGLGAIWHGIAQWAAGFFGGFQGGIPHMIIVVGAGLLITGLVVGLLAPVDAAVLGAAVVPAVLMLTTYGFVHSFWLTTSVPAEHVAAQFGNWLGG